MGHLDEVSPPGWKGTTRAMKEKHPEIDNPWALAWHMKKKGDKPHYKNKEGTPEKKEKYKEKKSKFKEFCENKEKPLKEAFSNQEILYAWQTIESYIKNTADKIALGQNTSALMNNLMENIKSELEQLDFYLRN